jgi:hypothetical protein
MNTKTTRLVYADAAFQNAPTFGETSLAFQRLRDVADDKDVRAPLVRFAQDLIEAHDRRAEQDNPVRGGETGRMRCGCLDCRNAKAALDAEEVSP